MAEKNLVRIRKRSGLVSFLILAVFFVTFKILGYNSSDNFSRTREWGFDSTLTINDFLLFYPIFDDYDACIASQTYLYNSSVTQTFRAGCYIDRSESSIKKKHVDNAQLMRHEEYHVKYTHLFSCELDSILLKRKVCSPEEANALLDSTYIKRTTMQSLYDKETNHGLILTEQLRWEYLIDTSTLLYKKRYQIDTITGLHFLNLKKTQPQFYLDNKNVTIFYGFELYGIDFQIFCHNESYDSTSLINDKISPSDLTYNLYEASFNIDSSLVNKMYYSENKKQNVVEVKRTIFNKNIKLHAMCIFKGDRLRHLREKIAIDFLDKIY